MRRGIVTVAVFALTCLAAWQAFTPAAADSPTVLVMDIDGPIQQLTADHIGRGMDTAHRDDVELVVIRLNAPGGLLDSTRKIVQELLDSEVPVAVYVSPAGAHAGSAGTFIAAAANFAVMAPGANIGAFSPLEAGGRKISGSQARKISEDMRAFIRSIAEARGRNADALENTVWNAIAYSPHEALNLGVVDLIAPDLPTALNQLHGRQTTTATGSVTIESRDARVRYLGPTVLEHILGILARPEVVFVLFVTACLALLVEVIFPGLIIPSLAGVITLALAIVGIPEPARQLAGGRAHCPRRRPVLRRDHRAGLRLVWCRRSPVSGPRRSLFVRRFLPPLGSAGTELHGESDRDRGDGRDRIGDLGVIRSSRSRRRRGHRRLSNRGGRGAGGAEGASPCPTCVRRGKCGLGTRTGLRRPIRAYQSTKAKTSVSEPYTGGCSESNDLESLGGIPRNAAVSADHLDLAA